MSGWQTAVLHLFVPGSFYARQKTDSLDCTVGCASFSPHPWLHTEMRSSQCPWAAEGQPDPPWASPGLQRTSALHLEHLLTSFCTDLGACGYCEEKAQSFSLVGQAAILGNWGSPEQKWRMHFNKVVSCLNKAPVAESPSPNVFQTTCFSVWTAFVKRFSSWTDTGIAGQTSAARCIQEKIQDRL